ncbi:MAG: hypothetical protein HQL63_13675 [Magnetococcales bacterium]|nr:hypothetical protein [Magnetococcales bacterium]
MVKFILSLIFLAFVLWALVKLRRMRERSKAQVLPSDQATLLLGLFYVISDACLRYHRAKGRYPSRITGAPDGLVEQGFLKDVELAKMTQAIPLFTIIVTELGYGVCLPNSTGSLVKEILERARMTGNNVLFMDWDKVTLVPLNPPIRNDFINLTLPLPATPPKPP